MLYIKINKDDVGKIVITYPDIKIQQKADTLDNFDAICSDLNTVFRQRLKPKQAICLLQGIFSSHSTVHSLLT